MSNGPTNEGAAAVAGLGEQNGEKPTTITVRVNIEPDMLKKMKSVVSLFPEEISPEAKTPEIVSFFLKKGFDVLVSTGEFENRLKSLLAG